jgi:hypothetical protein
MIQNVESERIYLPKPDRGQKKGGFNRVVAGVLIGTTLAAGGVAYEFRDKIAGLFNGGDEGPGVVPTPISTESPTPSPSTSPEELAIESAVISASATLENTSTPSPTENVTPTSTVENMTPQEKADFDRAPEFKELGLTKVFKGRETIYVDEQGENKGEFHTGLKFHLTSGKIVDNSYVCMDPDELEKFVLNKCKEDEKTGLDKMYGDHYLTVPIPLDLSVLSKGDTLDLYFENFTYGGRTLDDGILRIETSSTKPIPLIQVSLHPGTYEKDETLKDLYKGNTFMSSTVLQSEWYNKNTITIDGKEYFKPEVMADGMTFIGNVNMDLGKNGKTKVYNFGDVVGEANGSVRLYLAGFTGLNSWPENLDFFDNNWDCILCPRSGN